MNCPDNLDIYDQYEAEQDRMKKHRKKQKLEDDLPWYEPNDYGSHEDCYYGGEMKDRIEELLWSADRDGMNDLLKRMELMGFYDAPCSTQHHLCKPGGLMEHSLNVCDIALSLVKTLDSELNISDDSIVICALLHDIGKCGQFDKPNYVPNMIKDGRPTKADPEQKYKQSESKPYETNNELLRVDHEVRALQIISKYIDLTEEESFAILHHNGMYGNLKYALSGKETALQILIHFADMWASRVMEIEKKLD